MNIPLKYHGGKRYLAKRIVALFPRHLHYVEPYFGGGSVLFARDPNNERLWLLPHKGVSELINDINGNLINFWRVLQSDQQFAQFRRQVEATPLSREEWKRAKDIDDEYDPDEDYCDGTLVDMAVAFFVRCRQSLAGRMNDWTAMTRTRTRRGMNGNVSEWLGAVEGLPAVHDRLKRVVIERRPALEVIKREDTPGTLFYCDPPYLHETRTATKVYDHEMTESDHVELLETLVRCKGEVMLSGYSCDLYHQTLRGWNCHSFDLPNNAAGGGSKRRMTEMLWCNF